MKPSKTARRHWAVLIDNRSRKIDFIETLLNGHSMPEGFEELQGLKGALFSKYQLDRLIDEEERHDKKIITKNASQSLKSMSSGEQKKALLAYLLKTNPDFLILDNPFDNLDTDFQRTLITILSEVSSITQLVQLASRRKDLLPFITDFFSLEKSILKAQDANTIQKSNTTPPENFDHPIPSPLAPITYEHDQLIVLKNVSVSFEDKSVLKNINWEIERNEFWQLAGKNGSGKTTLLSMITGENPKGYGQELYIFGQKKGSGESIWDIKKQIGYFTPSMTDTFAGYHTVEHMLISGLTDSIGLYTKPTGSQLRLARQWLMLIGLWNMRNTYFHDLTMGEQRLVMTVRAMVKHPLLLILDEPTAGMDDASAALLIALVNKMAAESKTTTLFVSHRTEPRLKPEKIFKLTMTPSGSKGKVIY